MKGAHTVVKIIDLLLPVNLRILKIIRHQRTLDQTPSVADEKAKTQGEMTCLSNSRWSQNMDSGSLAILPADLCLAMQWHVIG